MTDKQTDRQADGNEKHISSYSRGHERLRKHKSRESPDGLDYNTSLAYTREVKILSTDTRKKRPT